MTSVTSVPLLDLEAQYKPIIGEVMTAVAQVFASKQFILGPKVEELETNIAKYCNVEHAIGVSSGTDALLLALMALGIGHGDEVITTPFTFFATAGSIARVGAIPVFVDIDPDTFNIDPTKIEEAISEHTKAIMPVHLFGQMADMPAINEIAKRHGLWVIEDASQAIGCNYTTADNQVVWAGEAGDIGVFSFFPSKNLGGVGDGGMAVTKHEELAKNMKLLRNHGAHERYFHDMIGGNFRLDALQAAVLNVKLPYLEAQHQQRQKNAAFYNKKLKNITQIPIIKPGYRMIYNQYTLRVADRAALQAHLNKENIGNAIYYPLPLHIQTCFSSLGYEKGQFPLAESAAEEVLSIPIYAELTDAQLAYVAKGIESFFNK